MTLLLERAIEEARRLSNPAQDAIGAFILKQIAHDQDWDEAFIRSQDRLSRFAVTARGNAAIQGVHEH